MCRSELLQKNAAEILRKCEKVFGTYLTYQTFIRWTMFRQFVAGEREDEVKLCLAELDRQGVGSILDYAAEADVPGVPDPGAEKAPPISLTKLIQFPKVQYAATHPADDNFKLFLISVAHASLVQSKTSQVTFAALKITGLCDPQLLARASAVLLGVRQLWIEIVSHATPPPLEECRVVIGRKLSADAKRVDIAVVTSGLRRSFPNATPAEIENLVQLWKSSDGATTVNYFKFSSTVEATLLGDKNHAAVLAPLLGRLPPLTDQELALWRQLTHRVDLILRTAVELNVRVMVDAEQTFYQMAIDHIVRTAQRQYNRNQPTVYNTYQCFLKFAQDRLTNDMKRAEVEGWMWAGKIVRGAYLRQEREASTRHNYESPIWETKPATDACYTACAKQILDEIQSKPTHQYGVLFGTHSRSSLEVITQQMQTLPASYSTHIAFAQLYGMADHLTMPMAKAGYATFKYVPYGPVKETIAYLMRRAQENSGVIKDTASEAGLMKDELRRRFMVRSP